MLERVQAVSKSIGANANNALLFAYGSDSYLFISDGTIALAATDVLIKLTGITDDTLTIVSGNVTAIS